jgi:hypothetical protein
VASPSVFWEPQAGGDWCGAALETEVVMEAGALFVMLALLAPFGECYVIPGFIAAAQWEHDLILFAEFGMASP